MKLVPFIAFLRSKRCLSAARFSEALPPNSATIALHLCSMILSKGCDCVVKTSAAASRAGFFCSSFDKALFLLTPKIREERITACKGM